MDFRRSSERRPVAGWTLGDARCDTSNLTGRGVDCQGILVNCRGYKMLVRSTIQDGLGPFLVGLCGSQNAGFVS